MPENGPKMVDLPHLQQIYDPFFGVLEKLPVFSQFLGREPSRGWNFYLALPPPLGWIWLTLPEWLKIGPSRTENGPKPPKVDLAQFDLWPSTVLAAENGPLDITSLSI